MKRIEKREVMKIKNITVLGAGSWGTALGNMLFENGHEVTLWTLSEEHADEMMKSGCNENYLPGIKLPKGLKINSNIEESMQKAEMIVYALPSRLAVETLERMTPYLTERQRIISVSKGFEKDGLQRISEVIKEKAPMCKVGVLSGPSHAEEVAKKIPTACVASADDGELLEEIQDAFMNSYFRVYTNDDMVGVEIGGALKNIIALACGIVDGVGWGDNTKAAIITRGMSEIARLGVAMGGNEFTFSGLSGIGDLIVTCTSVHSRNRRAGILLGEGKSLEEVLREVKMVVEGVDNAKAAYRLSEKYKVAMPITTEVYRILFEGKELKESARELMMRDKKSELEASYKFGIEDTEYK